MVKAVYKRENGLHILTTDLGIFKSQHSREAVEDQYDHAKMIEYRRRSARRSVKKKEVVLLSKKYPRPRGFKFKLKPYMDLIKENKELRAFALDVYNKAYSSSLRDQAADLLDLAKDGTGAPAEEP